MESVGPVDFGDSVSLPDFSRFEQCFGIRESAAFRVKQTLSPLSPACRKANLPVHKTPWAALAMGMESGIELVASFLPWFMPNTFHSVTQAEIRI